MSVPATSNDDLVPYVAYVCSDEGASVARAVVDATGGDSTALHGGGLSGAARLAGTTATAQTVLTEMGNIPLDMACECVAEICQSGASVIVLGSHTDITTYRALLRAGATEYFSFPVSAHDVLAAKPAHQPEAPDNVVQLQAASPAPSRALSIGVMGCAGGVGASLLAQNLAFYGASATGGDMRTGLLDADLQFGSQAIDLDRDETDGLFEALMAPDRIDNTFINATMDELGPKLALYSHQIGAGQDAAAFEAGLPRLVPRLRGEFDALVTDLPRGLMLQQPTLAAHLDALVLVIPAGFAGVNAASRLIRLLTAQSAGLRILPVLSDVRRDAKLSQKDIARTIDQPVIATLPQCDAQMAKAHRSARPLIEGQPRSAYAGAVRTIWNAAHVAAKEPAAAAPARPLLKRIFG